MVLKPIFTGSEWEKNLLLIFLPVFVTLGRLFSLNELSVTIVKFNVMLRTFLCDYCTNSISGG